MSLDKLGRPCQKRWSVLRASSARTPNGCELDGVRMECKRSKRSTAFLAACAAVGIIAPHLRAAEPRGDAEAGRSLALTACTGCHVVATDQPFKPIYPGPLPDFKTIANKPNTTAASLKHYLETLPDVPKPGQMANPLLSSKDLQDVVAYIVSLRDVSQQDHPPAH